MQIHTSIAAMRQATKTAHRHGQTIALVPTMGAIHQGHLSLVRAARRESDVVTASIFVNPLQFAPHEDLARYPRPFEDDVSLLREAGVDQLFAPTAEEMYPAGATTFVEVEGLSSRLDGVSRPGHLRGVATVVLKLFCIVQPDTAFFGQKDAAQLAVVRAMVRSLDVPVRIVGCPIVRDPDGLALSSRNRFLSPEERRAALTIPDVLARAQTLADPTPANLRAFLHAAIGQAPGLRLDYVAVVDPDTLLPAEDLSRPTLLAVAAWVGNTRLIDNAIFEPAVLQQAYEPELAHHV